MTEQHCQLCMTVYMSSLYTVDTLSSRAYSRSTESATIIATSFTEDDASTRKAKEKAV